MPWLQVRIHTSAEHVDEISAAMSEAGASAITLQDAEDQPLYEPPPGATPLWQQNRLIALFDADTDLQRVHRQLQARLGEERLQDWSVEALEDKDWVRAWMDNYQPLRFGEQLWIVPSWMSPPDADAVNILLDPGLAFGTGTHPTTAMCLRWLDAHPPRDQTVLDYGCGSGILAIAAARLKADHVMGVDSDPQALRATRENAEKNAVANLSVYTPDTLPETPVDLLLANILAEPLLELCERFARLVRSGGHIVLSGILARQAETLLEHYRPYFHLKRFAEQEEWVCLTGTRH